MESRITLIPGDGIGPEIVREAVKVLDSVADTVTSSIIPRFLWVDAQLMSMAFHLQMKQ